MSTRAMAATASAPGSAPTIAACAHRPSACSSQARSSVGRSRPASPGITRRTGTTSQLVVARTNSPTGLRNGTRSHWKWKRASSMKTKNATTVSTRKTPIWVNTSVLSARFSELAAELGRAPARGLDRARKTLGDLFLVEYLERRLGGAAPGGHLPPELGRAVGARGRELRRAEDRVQRELSRNIGR